MGTDKKEKPIYKSPLEIVNSKEWITISPELSEYKKIKSYIVHRAKNIIEYFKNNYPATNVNNETALIINHEGEIITKLSLPNNRSQELSQAMAEQKNEPQWFFMGYRFSKK